MCAKFHLKNLNHGPCTPHPAPHISQLFILVKYTSHLTTTYTCKMTIAPKVRSS